MQVRALCVVWKQGVRVHSAYNTTIVVELERSLQIVLDRIELLVAEEVLKKRKDTLAQGRVWRHGKDDAGSEFRFYRLSRAPL